MNKLEKLTKRISRLFNWIALAALSCMLLLVATDIIGSKVFGQPVPGAMDLTSLLGILLIGFSMPQTYLMGRHIKVDFVMTRLRPSLRKPLRSVSLILVTVFFACIVCRLFVYAQGLYSYGEKTMTIQVPLFPFAYALAISFFPMLLAVPLYLYRTWKGMEDE
ncbi:MAG: TRAP transporter small permease [Desulfobacteraceae bacterium]|nr:TRAP transporter small permease [Desulfobacteraceae bacterium]